MLYLLHIKKKCGDDNVNKKKKKLRKTLNLTMEKFGAELGVGKTAISKLEHGERALTDQMINSICKTNWNGRYVNELWLRNGIGDMFIPIVDSELDALIAKYQLSSDAKLFIEKFINMKPESQEIILNFVIETAAAINSLRETSVNDTLTQEAIDREVENYRRELEAEAKGEKSSAFAEVNAKEKRA